MQFADSLNRHTVHQGYFIRLRISPQESNLGVALLTERQERIRNTVAVFTVIKHCC